MSSTEIPPQCRFAMTRSCGHTGRNSCGGEGSCPPVRRRSSLRDAAIKARSRRHHPRRLPILRLQPDAYGRIAPLVPLRRDGRLGRYPDPGDRYFFLRFFRFDLGCRAKTVFLHRQPFVAAKRRYILARFRRLFHIDRLPARSGYRRGTSKPGPTHPTRRRLPRPPAHP